MATSPIILSTGVGTNDSMNICGLQAHEVRELIYDDLPLCTSFVYSFDAPPLPVSPVDIVPQQGKPKYVGDFVFHEHSSPSPIGIHNLNFVCFRSTSRFSV